MFALQPRAGFAVAARVFLATAILFNALIPTAASASSGLGQEQSTDSSAGGDLQEKIPVQEEKKTGWVSNEPISSNELTQIDSETALPSDLAANEPSLALVSEPDYLTPNSTLTLTWTIEGLSLQDHPSLELQITLPEGLTLEPGYPGTYNESTRILTVPVTTLSGQINLLTGQTVTDAEVRAILLENTQSILDGYLFLPAHEQYLITQQGGEIITNNGKVKIKIPADTFKKDTYIEVGKPSKKHCRFMH